MNDNFYYTIPDEDDDELTAGFDRSGVDSGENDDSQDYEDSDLSLGFIRHIGEEFDGYNQYEFMFTIHPDEFWGEGFEYQPAGLCNDLCPDSKYIQKIVMVKTQLTFDLVQDSGCYSIQDCMDGCVCLASERLGDEYPDIRLVFKFGENYVDVERKLAAKQILI
jgi:hypothetical protein